MSARHNEFDPDEDRPVRATVFDVVALLGDIEPARVAKILWLRPTVAELDEAVALAGDPAASGHRALSGRAAAVYDLLVGTTAAERDSGAADA